MLRNIKCKEQAINFLMKYQQPKVLLVFSQTLIPSQPSAIKRYQRNRRKEADTFWCISFPITSLWKDIGHCPTNKRGGGNSGRSVHTTSLMIQIPTVARHHCHVLHHNIVTRSWHFVPLSPYETFLTQLCSHSLPSKIILGVEAYLYFLKQAVHISSVHILI